MPDMYANEIADSHNVDMHDVLERIKNCDSEISRIQKNREELLSIFHKERKRLDEHYSLVVETERPMVDPGTTTRFSTKESY